MKDCVFQYATSDGVVKQDTNLITRANAEELWQKYIPVFKEDMRGGLEPEMRIWVDMEDDCDFHKTCAHWCSRGMLLNDDELYNQLLNVIYEYEGEILM